VPRLALSFLVALILGAAVTGVGLTRILSTPAPATPMLGPPSTTASLDGGMRHLPQWVQTRQATPLWSGPDKQAVRFVELPAWTFLKVSSAQDDRLQVSYAGDGNTRQSGPGWVALSDVQPSDPSGEWLRNHRASQLFVAPTGSSASAAVPQWSWMLRLDGSANGRLQVRVYSSALSQVVGEGWLPADDVGPADPPQHAIWTASDHATPGPAFPSHSAFIDAVSATAQPTSTSVPVSVTVAQAILESNWGESLLSREANNYFGIKATGQIGNDGAVWMPTLEYVAGGSVSVLAPFRAYRSLGDSVADHAQLFDKLNLYRSANQALSNPDEFARRIAQAGYSTDPSYAQKVIDLMRRYDLYRLDGPQPSRASNTAESA
jgi:Mannosyl-glycoprotein endo-beta-N-acetylglucosaminidase